MPIAENLARVLLWVH